MQRVWVVGSSGAGKTTLARRLAEALGCEHVELDAIHHQPGWVEMERDAFRRVVTERLRQDRWVVDGNYSKVADIVEGRADTVVWLDLPRPQVIRRLILRTLKRGAFRTELWNGNRESLFNLVRWDPERSVVRWAWTRWEEYQERYEGVEATFAGRFERLRSDEEVIAFVNDVTAPGKGT